MALSKLVTLAAVKDWVNQYADVPNADHADTADSATTADTAGDADTVDGYDIQKDGTDGTGVINFKTK